MSARERIYCPNCGEECGVWIPADHTTPGFAEGIGEDFTDDAGVWYCPQDCLIAAEESEGEDE